MSTILSILIIPAVIILGSAIYFIYYKNSINRHLNDENYTERHHNPAPIYIALGIAIISLLINTSKNQLAITNLENNINNLNSQIWQLSEKIDDLSKKDSTVYAYGLDLIDLQKTNGQYYATVRLTVYPEMLQGETEFTLRYEGQSYSLKEENGVYYTDVTYPSASGGGSGILSITCNGKTQNDEIYFEGEKILGSLLPTVTITGSSEIKTNRFIADWEILLYHSEERKITDAVLIVKDGDKEKEISLDKALSESRMSAKLNESISSEDTLEVYISYHDNKGFTYRETIVSFQEPYHLTVTDSEGVTVISL